VILLDTCVLIFDALTPERLTPTARSALDQGDRNGSLACADISLWEIAMLIAKGRLRPGTDALEFCRLALSARGIRCLPVTPEIAACSTTLPLPQADPADRLIAATSVILKAPLVTADARLSESAAVETIW
jgi:PIN domain nuclease of toxin-antitoxin system